MISLGNWLSCRFHNNSYYIHECLIYYYYDNFVIFTESSIPATFALHITAVTIVVIIIIIDINLEYAIIIQHCIL